jgi:hypothetical protein
MSAISYPGWKNCLRISNGEIELIVTIDVGPRVIRCGFVGGENEFAEYPEQINLANDSAYHSYGGHRLWAAPEVRGWTNHPDDHPVDWHEEGEEFILVAPREEGTGLQKSISICLDKIKNHARIKHTIINHNNHDVSLAPWAISVMAPGGRLIVPQEPFISHIERVLPVRPLVLWGYTDMQDPRWVWGNKYIQLRQDTRAKTPQKFGMQINQGWAAYANGDRVFIKRFPFKSEATYPDFSCNAEFFTNQRMLEVESLGPILTLRPGESTSHLESWFLFRDIRIGESEQSIGQSILPLVEQSIL